MILLPAIDIRGGRAVRLQQGRFEKETVYVDDPLDAARSWIEHGARQLHVVDLDGAREGRPVNLHQLERIARELDVPVQYGGGLRSEMAVREALLAAPSASCSARPPTPTWSSSTL
jgi:phosphoribosylformimino-5-aminoimidazole carboxamide ribonucleotide (ProFAR) isomerase